MFTSGRNSINVIARPGTYLKREIDSKGVPQKITAALPVPTLEAAPYTLEVRKRTTPTGTPRSGQLTATLTGVPPS